MTAVLAVAALAAASVNYRRVHDHQPDELVAFTYDASNIFGPGTVGIQHYAYWADGNTAAGAAYITERGWVL